MILSFDVYGPEYTRLKTLTPGYFKAMRENGFRMAILKSSMGYGVDKGCQDFVALLKDHFDIAFYHWADPTAPAKSQAAWLKKQIEIFRPKAIFLDIEQRFAWNTNPKVADLFDRSKRLPAQQIVNCGTDLLTLLRPLGLPLEVYTYPYFITEHCMGAHLTNGENVTGKGYLSNGGWWRDVVWPWPSALKPWLAAYPSVPKTGLRTNTWPGFQNFLYSKVQPNTPELISHVNLFSSGKKVTWQWWQFASNVWLPGFYNVDMSIFNGDEDKYKAWIFQEPVEELEPAEPVLIKYRVKPRCNPNIRLDHNVLAKKVTMLTAGTDLLVTKEAEEDITNGYIQIVQPVQGWVHTSLVERITP